LFHGRFIRRPYKWSLPSNSEEERMRKRTKLLIAGASVLALAAGGAGVAGATGGDDSHPITGSALDEASAIALKATGGGSVTETEAGDEESYYQVEVTKADGSQVDVQLDRGFNLVGQSADGESQDPGR
jgi:hypothetical protein